MKSRSHPNRSLLKCALIIAISIFSFQMHASLAAQNLAVQLLNRDSTVRTVTPQMYTTLNDVMDDACSRIQKLPPKQPGWDPVYANAALKCIDDALVEHGFVYPDIGLIDELCDGLTPFQISDDRKSSFELEPHNARRVAMIEKRFPGPFYAVDCDTASFIYLGVGDRLHLPIRFIDLPGYGQNPGHNIVRWREGDHFIDWETMDGCEKSNDYYMQEWNLNKKVIGAGAALTDLTPKQVLGYEDSLLAIQYSRRGDFDNALSELNDSFKLYPQNLLACNNYAWYTAVATHLKKRDFSEALARIQYALNLFDDPNARDTLATLYASQRMFDKAVAEEEKAVSAYPSPDFSNRLQLFKAHKAYHEDKETDTPGGVFKP